MLARSGFKLTQFALLQFWFVALIAVVNILMIPTSLSAQRTKQRPVERPERNKGNGLLIHLNYGGGIPLADLATRFGNHQTIGLGLDYITKGNLIYGFETNFLFGSKVKEDPVAILRTPEGDIIGNDQVVVDFSLKERGLFWGGRIGYLIPLLHKRSGILVSLGGGYFRHRFRLQDNTGTAIQLAGEYKKGYDRLTAGPALSQFIGYQHLVRNSGLNFYAGVESIQAFTQSQRSYDFSTQMALTGKRTDITLGLKLGFILPFVFESAPEEIYY